MIVTKKVKHGETKEDVSQSHEFPNNCAGCVEKYGEDVVYANFVVAAGTALRNRLFGLTHGNSFVTAEAAIEATKDWMPGKPSERMAKDPVAEFAAYIASIEDPEARKAATNKAREMIKAKDGAATTNA